MNPPPFHSKSHPFQTLDGMAVSPCRLMFPCDFVGKSAKIRGKSKNLASKFSFQHRWISRLNEIFLWKHSCEVSLTNESDRKNDWRGGGGGHKRTAFEEWRSYAANRKTPTRSSPGPPPDASRMIYSPRSCAQTAPALGQPSLSTYMRWHTRCANENSIQLDSGL